MKTVLFTGAGASRAVDYHLSQSDVIDQYGMGSALETSFGESETDRTSIAEERASLRFRYALGTIHSYLKPPQNKVGIALQQRL